MQWGQQGMNMQQPMQQGFGQPQMGQMPMGHPAAQSQQQQYPPHMGHQHPPLAQQQLSPTQLSPTQLSPPAQQQPAQPTAAWGASSPEEHRWPLPSESADAGAMNHGAAPSQARQEVRTAHAILVRFARCTVDPRKLNAVLPTEPEPPGLLVHCGGSRGIWQRPCTPARCGL